MPEGLRSSTRSQTPTLEAVFNAALGVVRAEFRAHTTRAPRMRANSQLRILNARGGRTDTALRSGSDTSCHQSRQRNETKLSPRPVPDISAKTVPCGDPRP